MLKYIVTFIFAYVTRVVTFLPVLLSFILMAVIATVLWNTFALFGTISVAQGIAGYFLMFFLSRFFAHRTNTIVVPK